MKSELTINRDTPSLRKHRHEILWQVMFPLVSGVIIMLLLMGLSVAGASDQSRLADISVIWLIIPLMFGSIALFILLIGVIYGLVVLIRLLPKYTQQAQSFIKLMGTRVSEMDDRIVAPVIKGHISSARFRKLFDQILRR